MAEGVDLGAFDNADIRCFTPFGEMRRLTVSFNGGLVVIEFIEHEVRWFVLVLGDVKITATDFVIECARGVFFDGCQKLVYAFTRLELGYQSIYHLV